MLAKYAASSIGYINITKRIFPNVYNFGNILICERCKVENVHLLFLVSYGQSGALSQKSICCVAVQGYNIQWDSIWEPLVSQTKIPLNSHSIFILVKSSESNRIPKFAEGNILWTSFGDVASIVFIRDRHHFL